MASSLGVAIVVAACKGDDASVTPDDAGAVVSPPPAKDDASEPEPVVPDPDATGFPCEVQEVLENRCQVCHAAGSPTGALMTYDDLKANSTKDPTKTRAQLSVEMMKAGQMPPAQRADDDEIAAIEAWVTDGLPKNPKSCSPLTAEEDAGDAGNGVENPTGKCTSGVDAGPGNNELMRPGEACIACHVRNRAPDYLFAGTVFPSFRDPNGCNGSPPPVTVKITNSRDASVTMQVNDAGNFFRLPRLAPGTPRFGNPPYSVELSTPDGRKRKMMRTVPSGDCNGCHTQQGDGGAPGRIVAP